MQITSPLPVSALGPNDPAQELRPFQRVTAAVLQVSPMRAVLSIAGFPVVAEISSSEVAAALKGRSLAQFVMSHAQDGRILLRLLDNPPASAAEGLPASDQSLAVRLLDVFNLPASASNLTIAQAALNQRLELLPGQLEAMLHALGSLPMPAWGEAEANLAAAVLAAGLPLTPQSLELAGRPGGQVAQGLAGLLSQLNLALQDNSLPPEFKELLQRVYKVLQEAVLDPASPESLSEKLAAAIRLLGRPLENQLASQGSIMAEGRNLAGLAQLRQEAARLGLKDLSAQADAFWKDLSQSQFFNLPAASGKGEQWLEAAFLMRLPTSDAGEQQAPVRLLVARRPRRGSASADPDRTHVILQVDLDDRRVIQVEIGLNHHRVQAEVTLPDDALCESARQELPALQERLADLGYALGETTLSVGVPAAMANKLPVLLPQGAALSGINREA